jgi:Domain of unknown function (DUF222)
MAHLNGKARRVALPIACQPMGLWAKSPVIHGLRPTEKLASVEPITIEYMFDIMEDAAVVDAVTDAARAQNAMCARELAAIGELYARRAPGDDANRFNWAVDGHENVVAEAAALGISRGRAAGRLRFAIALRERQPRGGRGVRARSN